MGSVPAAVAVKLKNTPCFPLAFGALVILTGESTVSVATELVTEPAVFETTTV
jgi:hypothetical protein